MKRQSNGKVTVKRDERGVVEFVGTEQGKPVRKPAQAAAQASHAQQAAQYLRRYGALWALDRAGSDAIATRTSASRGDGKLVRFQQDVDGMPVLGGELVVALDRGGNLRSVTGETTPLSLSQRERKVTPEQARETAITLAARAHDVPASALRASEPEPYAYDPTLLGSGNVATELAPVYKIEVTGPAHVDHLVLVDRTRGSVPLNFNQVSHALDRVVCDRNDTPDDTDANGNPKLAICKRSAAAREEGEGATGVTDVDAAYDYAGDTAEHFQSELGIDLTEMIGIDVGNGYGKRLRSTVRYCLPEGYGDCPMANAFWNGNGVYYGKGMPRADDVVSHELTHGVIEQTANLAYFYQSGAINESMADVFGELVDLNNDDAEIEPAWKLGEDSPFGVVRDMADPEATNQPDRMTSATYASEPVTSNRWDNGGVHTNSGVGNKAAYLIARDESQGPVDFNGQTITGIGNAKAIDVYYETLRLLASGADYEDLFHTLPQACANLAGTGGIDSGDCDTVTAAVTATEMNQQPPGAKAPEAPVCPTGTQKADVFHDGFGSLNNWRTTNGMWHRVNNYAKSGTYSMYGWEPIRELGEPKRTFAKLTKRFEIPRGVKTFLRFDHQYLFAHYAAATQDGNQYFAGGVLQYSTNGGKSYRSAAGLPWVNGPDETIENWDPDGATIESKYKGFGGDSHGYMSSRVNVTSLAGKDVVFRWRITADPEFSFDGWTLDNVNLYACGADRPSSPSNQTAIGKFHRAVVTWQPPVWGGDGGVRKYSIAVRHAGSVVRYIDDIPADATRYVVRGLGRETTYNFRMRAHSTAGAGGFSQHVLRGTTLVASTKPRVFTFGRWTTISGTMVNTDNQRALSGQKVVLKGRPRGGNWRTIARTHTDDNGHYSFRHKPFRNFQYKVFYWSGNQMRMWGRTDLKRVWVRQKVTAWFNDYRPDRGQWVALRGRVAPKHAGQVVKLQQWDRGDKQWKTIKRKRLNSDSKYKFSLRRWQSRWFAFRVVKPGHFDHKKGFSPVRRIYVS